MVNLDKQVLRDALALVTQGGILDDDAREMLTRYGIPPRNMHRAMPDLPEDLRRLGEEREAKWEHARCLWRERQELRESPNANPDTLLAMHNTLIAACSDAGRDNPLAPRPDDLTRLLQALRAKQD